MNYYTNVFSPETYEAFSRSDRSVSGFNKSQLAMANRVSAGDRFICYLTKLSRWIGVLEVIRGPEINDERSLCRPLQSQATCLASPRFSFLTKEKGIPIHESVVWDALSFTKGNPHNASVWTGMFRRSPNHLLEDDGRILEELITQQVKEGQVYAVDEDVYRRALSKSIHRSDRTVSVTVPVDDEEDTDTPAQLTRTRESSKIQAMLASIGEKMGFRIWIPKADRSAVQQEWTPDNGSLIDVLPLNYDETTLQTIEQIDVLWLKKRSIVRAFEVEHTTAIYSGILRMADLLALQPNMNIKLHIVAPESRKEKVFTEIRRPVFSLLDQAPLAECCTFLSYDSLRELSQDQHLQYLSDGVLEKYEEEAG